MNDMQMLNDLQAAIDELWRQKCKAYKKRPDEYTRGEMNVVNMVKQAIYRKRQQAGEEKKGE